jgi:hypothetical protein
MNPLVAWFLLMGTINLEAATFWTDLAEKMEGWDG